MTPAPIVTRLEEAVEAAKARLLAIAATRTELDAEEAGIRRYLPPEAPVVAPAAPERAPRRPVAEAVKGALAEGVTDWSAWSEKHGLNAASVRRAIRRRQVAA